MQDCSEAIAQEASVLRELATVAQLQGRIPKYVQAGTIIVGHERFKFLVTEYFFEYGMLGLKTSARWLMFDRC
jgi:hypothetical protein